MGRRGRPRHPDILTPREWEVLELVRQRFSNEQIAQRLGISVDGAKYHVSQILSKLGVATREEAAEWRPTEKRRGWWAWWPLWAKVASTGIVAVAATGLAVLALGVLRTGDGDGEITNGGVQVRVCAADPAWVQPSLADILSERNPMFYYIRGTDEASARAGYERKIYEVFPGNSVNQGWVAVSGLRGVVDPPGCPNAVERGRSQGRSALYALAGFEPIGATREDDRVKVLVRRLGHGWTDMELTLDPPLLAGGAISFVEESGNVVSDYPLH